MKCLNTSIFRFLIGIPLMLGLTGGMLTSCASKKYSRNDFTFSFNQIQTTVRKHLPQGIEWISTNYREIRSQYFRPELYRKYYYSKKKGVHRAKARIWILGDRRPYRFILRVYIERRKSEGPRRVRSQADLMAGQWVFVQQDGDIAKSLGRAIYNDLIDSTRNWDLIDNFRPY